MRIQDIIRGILDIIDGAHPPVNQSATVIVAQPVAEPEDVSPLTHAGDDINRWRQIIDLADKSGEPYSTEPNEKYADIDSVTNNAGGGVNGPKHPHDIRVKDPSAYPNQQEF